MEERFHTGSILPQPPCLSRLSLLQSHLSSHPPLLTLSSSFLTLLRPQPSSSLTFSINILHPHPYFFSSSPTHPPPASSLLPLTLLHLPPYSHLSSSSFLPPPTHLPPIGPTPATSLFLPHPLPATSLLSPFSSFPLNESSSLFSSCTHPPAHPPRAQPPPASFPQELPCPISLFLLSAPVSFITSSFLALLSAHSRYSVLP